MLVLSRKTHQFIKVGDNIVIHIIEIRGGVTSGGQVRIGIEAPLDVPIIRGELLADWRGGSDQLKPE